MSANIEGMINEAIQSLRAGKKADARKLLEKAIELNEYSEEAWLWLSAVVDTDEDKRVCLENVLIVNPNNERAKKGLQSLSGSTPAVEPVQDDLFAPPPHVDEPPIDTEIEPGYVEPPTATSSASAVFNPANEISEDEYDDWVVGLNLDNSGAEPDYESQLPDDNFTNIFGGGAVDDDSEDDLRQSILADTSDFTLNDPQNDDSMDSMFDDTDFDGFGSTPFSGSVFAVDDDDMDSGLSRRPASPVPEAPRHRGPASPIGSSAFADSKSTMQDDQDPDTYFEMIPKGIRATRLPGTADKPSVALILTTVVLGLLNLGAVVMLIANLSG